MPDIDATVNKRSPPSGRMSDNVRSVHYETLLPMGPLAPRAPRRRRERVDPVFTRAGADEIQQALELLRRSHNISPSSPQRTCPICHFCLLHTRHPEGGEPTVRRRDQIAAPTISGIKRPTTNF